MVHRTAAGHADGKVVRGEIPFLKFQCQYWEGKSLERNGGKHSIRIHSPNPRRFSRV